VTEWTISDTIFTPCSYKTRPGDGYCAFRLAVTGVPGVEHKMPDPEAPTAPLRVLIDEVTVMDAIRARVAFRNVSAFRSHLDTQRALDLSTEANRKAEQPLCHESFGVQAEVYAAQLAEEIDLSSAKVRLWWLEGEAPWGFSNWTNSPSARSAWLGACEGTNLVFRSSHPGAPEAIIDPQERPGVVQYMLEVVYESGGVEVSDWLEPADWRRPSWYEPIDYNADHRAEGFSAYTILDEVAPGYAWINEVNMYDGPSEYEYMNAATNQYVEIAVPAEANIMGWTLRFVGAGLGDDAAFVTNTVAMFGENQVPSKKSIGGAQNYVFLTVGNPFCCTSATRREGTVDGAWSFAGAEPCDQMMNDGRIACGYPIGIQLVRPSGIIEQQLVAAGTNTYAGIPYYGEIFSATNWTAKLQARYPGSGWFLAGEDTGDNRMNSLSATNQFAAEGMWTNELKTPGRINGGEWIDPDHPTPQGSSIILYANIEGGHVSQTTGAFIDATENLVLYVQKGNPAGTDIVYRVSHWYEIDSISENGVARPGYAGRGADGEPVVFTAAINASNNVTVTAKVRMDSRLKEYGLGPDNAYTEAILKWLTDGTTLRRDEDGNLIPFAHPDGDIALADHYDLGDNFKETLDLTTMYWLDMDPTISNLVLKAGTKMAHPATQRLDPVGIDVFMVISNKADATYAPYAPYTLRGIAPDDSSADYDGVWKAETFRVTGRLLTMPDDVKSYVSLKEFVFGPRSFKPAGEPDAFTSHIWTDYPYAPPSP
ncbi:MAG: hypothetical protein KBT68_09465, partial [bacterium]|nr:hypothetical protein [Candidatus Colisoma equi]